MGTRETSPGRDPLSVLAPEEAVVDQHPQHLLDIQRIALGRVDDGAPYVIGKIRLPQQVLEEALALIRAERLEREDGSLPPPVGTDIAKLGARRAQEHEGAAPTELRHVLDQVQECGLCPVDVLEDGHHGLLGSQAFEEPPDGPEGLLDSPLALAETHRRSNAIADQHRLVFR